MMGALAKLGLVELNATFFIMLINVGIFYFIVKKFLFVPVSNFMEKRKKSIEDSINEADKKLIEADEYKNTYIEKLNNADAESKQIVDKAVTSANLKADSIIKEAKSEAVAIKHKAEKDIELERKKILNEAKNEISTIAILAASKVLESEIDESKNSKLVDKFIEEVGVMKWQD